jgi:hypothetical protein
MTTAPRPNRRDRLAAQVAEDRAQQRLQEARLNVPPDLPRAPHPWDATPEHPCIGGRRQHDFTRHDSDGLRRCWYCARTKPSERSNR